MDELSMRAYPRVLGIDLSINSTGMCYIEKIFDSRFIEYRYPNHYYNLISDSKYGKKVLAEYLELAKEVDKLDVILYQRCKSASKEYNTVEHAHQGDLDKILFHIFSIIKTVKPTKVVLEGLSFASRNTNSLTTLAGLHHFVRQVCDREGVEWQVVTPSELKKYATGKGNADKKMMVDAWHACDPSMNIIPVDDLADGFFLASYGLEN